MPNDYIDTIERLRNTQRKIKTGAWTFIILNVLAFVFVLGHVAFGATTALDELSTNTAVGNWREEHDSGFFAEWDTTVFSGDHLELTITDVQTYVMIEDDAGSDGVCYPEDLTFYFGFVDTVNGNTSSYVRGDAGSALTLDTPELVNISTDSGLMLDTSYVTLGYDMEVQELSRLHSVFGETGESCADEYANGDIFVYRTGTDEYGSTTVGYDGGDDYDIGVKILAEDSDPREAPILTVNEPDDDDVYYSVEEALYSVCTNVSHDDYGSENPTFEYELEYWDGDSWEDWTTWDEDYDEGNGNLMTCGAVTNAYAIVTIPNPPLPVFVEPDTYRFAGRVEFNGTDWSDWSSWNEFEIDITPYGGGGGGSWGDDELEDGTFDDWDTFFDGVPSHDTVYGACDFFSLAASQGDGLDCLWTWIQYAIFPPENYFFDYLRAPIEVLKTRWPFVYITNIKDSILAGFGGEASTCPMPSIFDATFLGQSVPEVDLCDWFSSVSGYFTANQTAEDIAITVVYILLAVGVWNLAKKFLLS